MLDLRRDLYAHLVISAQKDKSLNRFFKVIHSDSWNKYTLNQLNKPESKDDRTDFEKKVADVPTIKTVSTNTVPNNTIPNRILRQVSAEKIDEKVEKIISDPKIAEIKMELEVAEKLLEKIKSVDAHNSKIPVLEQTVFRMKTLLEQKSYV
jgi:hypothetical protein